MRLYTQNKTFHFLPKKSNVVSDIIFVNFKIKQKVTNYTTTHSSYKIPYEVIIVIVKKLDIYDLEKLEVSIQNCINYKHHDIGIHFQVMLLKRSGYNAIYEKEYYLSAELLYLLELNSQKYMKKLDMLARETDALLEQLCET